MKKLGPVFLENVDFFGSWETRSAEKENAKKLKKIMRSYKVFSTVFKTFDGFAIFVKLIWEITSCLNQKPDNFEPISRKSLSFYRKNLCFLY